jgi:cell division septation protein DedD
MAESGVREIQLSGKQLVFLFMASVVLVVVVFLLGVSVGRGARVTAGTVAATALVATNEPPIVAPPGTPASAADLTYQNRLTGSAGPAKRAEAGAAPGSAATPPATTSPPAHQAETAKANDPAPPAPPPAEGQTPEPAVAATPKTPPPSTSKPSVAPAGLWFVQVESFRSKDLANALVAKLKGKGYDAFIVDVPKPFLHVRVGPYPQRSAADGVVAQLKKDGFSSLVTR